MRHLGRSALAADIASQGQLGQVGSTPPASPTNGQSWLDLSTGINYTWVNDGDSAAWVELGPANGGASASMDSTVLVVASMALTGYAEVVVAYGGVTTSSKVMAQLVGELDAENDLEELADSNMQVFAVPEAGQIRFVLTGNGAFTGNFKTNYWVTL